MKPFSTLLALLAGAITLAGQTPEQFASKYRQLSAYEVRPGVLMTAKFTNERHVCEMTLEPWHGSPNPLRNRDTAIPKTLTKEIVDELVPSSERGEESPWLGSDSFVAGRTYLIERVFKNVTITEVGFSDSTGPHLVTIKWKHRSCREVRG